MDDSYLTSDEGDFVDELYETIKDPAQLEHDAMGYPHWKYWVLRKAIDQNDQFWIDRLRGTDFKNWKVLDRDSNTYVFVTVILAKWAFAKHRPELACSLLKTGEGHGISAFWVMGISEDRIYVSLAWLLAHPAEMRRIGISPIKLFEYATNQLNLEALQMLRDRGHVEINSPAPLSGRFFEHTASQPLERILAVLRILVQAKCSFEYEDCFDMIAALRDYRNITEDPPNRKQLVQEILETMLGALREKTPEISQAVRDQVKTHFSLSLRCQHCGKKHD